MVQTEAQRDQMREAHQAGKRAAALLLESTSGDQRQVIEAKIAQLYATCDESMKNYFQGMWHVIGSDPMCFYYDHKGQPREQLANSIIMEASDV